MIFIFKWNKNEQTINVDLLISYNKHFSGTIFSITMVTVRLMRNGIPCHSRDKAAINSYEEAVPRIIMERCLLGLYRDSYHNEWRKNIYSRTFEFLS